MAKERKKKCEKVQRKNRGITLIALVITIIVILILAGVSINTLFGDNGLLTKAEEAREANSHAQVKDLIQLEVHNYEIEKRSGSSNLSLIQHLEKAGYIKEYSEDKDSYVLQKDKLNNAELGKGTSIATGDVYVIEKENSTTGNITKVASTQESDIKPITKLADESTENEDWLLKYYKTESESKTLLNLTSITSTEDNETGDPVTPPAETVEGLKVGEYVSVPHESENILCRVLYNDATYGVQVITANNFETSNINWIEEIPEKLNEEATKTLDNKSKDMIEMSRAAGSDPVDPDDRRSDDFDIGTGPILYDKCYKADEGAMSLLNEFEGNFYLAALIKGNEAGSGACPHGEELCVQMWSDGKVEVDVWGSWDGWGLDVESHLPLAFRPVYKLNKNVTVTGKGTLTDPYVLNQIITD